METTLNKRSGWRLSEGAKKTIVDVIVYLFVALFVYTAASKFQTFDGFKTILSRSPLTGPYSTLIAWVIPVTEIVISLMLLIPATKKIGLLSATVLMLSFTGFLAFGLLSGSVLPCHCGGVISAMTWKQHIWFNLAFVSFAITGIKLYKK